MENKYPNFSWPPLFLAVAKEQNWKGFFYKWKRIYGGQSQGRERPDLLSLSLQGGDYTPLTGFRLFSAAACKHDHPSCQTRESSWPSCIWLPPSKRLAGSQQPNLVKSGWVTDTGGLLVPSRVRLLLLGQGEQVRPTDNPSPPSSDILWWIGERESSSTALHSTAVWNARKLLHKVCQHFLLNSQRSCLSHQFIFTDHHQGVKELRNIMHKSVKVLARNDKVVFYVSQISGWKTYCSERLKFQGCWFERLGFLLIFNKKQVTHFDVFNLMTDYPNPLPWRD